MFDSKPLNFRHDQFEAMLANGESVNIGDFSHEEEDLYCFYCQCKMIRVRGESGREWHYRHNYKSSREKNIECTYDLYLQALAEKKIYEWYNRIDHLMVRYAFNHVCSKFDNCKWHSISDIECSQCKYDIFDLKKKFPKILCGEIVRTTSLSSHRVYKLFSEEDQTKCINFIISTFEKESQIQMPEGLTIVVQIENEKDIDKLIGLNELKESRDISFYNFKVRSKPDFEYVGKVNISQTKLYRSGKLFFGSVLCTDTSTGPKAAVVINYSQRAHLSSVKNWMMAIASREPYCQHYCPMCKNRFYVDGNFYCKQTGVELNVNIPLNDCELYVADEFLIEKKIDEFAAARKSPSADVEIIIEDCI